MVMARRLFVAGLAAIVTLALTGWAGAARAAKPSCCRSCPLEKQEPAKGSCCKAVPAQRQSLAVAAPPAVVLQAPGAFSYAPNLESLELQVVAVQVSAAPFLLAHSGLSPPLA